MVAAKHFPLRCNGSRRATQSLGPLPLEPAAGHPLRPPPPPGGPAVYREHDRKPAPPDSDQPPTVSVPGGPPGDGAPAAPRVPARVPPLDRSVRAPVPAARPPGDAPMPLAGSARAPADPEGVAVLQAALLRAARRPWTDLPDADQTAAVDAGMLTAAAGVDPAATANEHDRAGTDPNTLPEGTPASVTGADRGDGIAAATAAAVAAAAGALQRQGLPPSLATPVDWTAFGVVIPVLASSPGVGASVAATVIADVLQMTGQAVMLVDPADPSRSGLTMAARSQGPWFARPHPQVSIRYSWRAQALLARLETTLPLIAPGMVPPPRFWRPPVGPLHATVVDLGHDPWRVAANPVIGAGAWLRPGQPMPRPVLVVRPSRPSLLHAEQLLARLETWSTPGVITPPAQLVVMGAKRWPAGVSGAAGRRVSALLASAVFMPHDPQLAAAGITAEVTPTRLRQAITPVLRRFDLAGEGTGRSTRAHHAQRGRTS
jgi:hypothetical protein